MTLSFICFLFFLRQSVPTISATQPVPGPPSPKVEQLRGQLASKVNEFQMFRIDRSIDDVIKRRIPVYSLISFLSGRLMDELRLNRSAYDCAIDYIYEELANRGYRFS